MAAHAPAEAERGHSTLRQVFVHAVAFVGAMVVTSGVAGLLRVALDGFGPPVLYRETDTAVALGLSLTVVGAPVWLVAWRAAQHGARGSPLTARSLPRRLYLAAVRAVALVVAVTAAVGVGLWIVQIDAFDPTALARLVVWGALWVFHERVAGEVPFGSSGTRRLDRVEVYLAAAGGLSLLAGGLGRLVASSLEVVYETVVGAGVLVEAAGPAGGLALELRTAAVLTVVGAGVWWWHWKVVGGRDVGSTGWFVYLFLAGVLAGTAAAVTSASVVVFHLLVWLLGGADQPAAQHFAVLPGAVAGLIVGVGLWGYHRAVLGEEKQPAATRGLRRPERAYWYLITGVGLLTAAGGMTTVLSIGVDLAVPGRTLVASPGLVREVVAGGLTLLVIGLPLWTHAWSAVQRAVRAEPQERTRLARRVLIFGAFGVAVVTSLASLGAALFAFFEALLAGRLSPDVVEQQRWSIALVATAGVVSIHYGLVLREDRAATAAAATAPEHGPTSEPEAAGRPAGDRQVALREVVVIATDPDGLADGLTDRLGVPATRWRARDLAAPGPGVDTAGELAARIRDLDAARVVVLVDGQGPATVVALA